MMVMMMASTPSLNASSRFDFIDETSHGVRASYTWVPVGKVPQLAEYAGVLGATVRLQEEDAFSALQCRNALDQV
jgi:hypothetical protein